MTRRIQVHVEAHAHQRDDSVRKVLRLDEHAGYFLARDLHVVGPLDVGPERGALCVRYSLDRLGNRERRGHR